MQLKGITPVIATILLLLVTISVISLAFFFFSRSQNTVLIQVENESEAFTGGIAHFSIDGVDSRGIYIRNLESSPINNQSISIYINNNKVDADPLDIAGNSVGAITLSDGIMPAGVYNIKVSSRASQDAYTYNIPLANNLQEPSFSSLARKPVDIALIIDKSGSMSGQKLADAKSASENFVDLALANDKIAVISYSNTASVLIGLSSDKMAVKNVIDSIISGGNTGIGYGISKATEELKKDTTGTDRVEILLTDGQENQLSYPLNKAQDAAGEGISIYTIGLGNDANRSMLTQIANMASGKYYLAPTSMQLEDIYTDISTQLGTLWRRTGAAEINMFGAACRTPPVCMQFENGTYPDVYAYQDVRFLFSGKYNVVTASAYVNPSGPMCDNACPSLPGERCRQNDARIHLIALDDMGNKLGESEDFWAGTLGEGWVNVQKTWLTPLTTKILRFQIDAGNCCASCSASGIYADDAVLELSNT